LIRAGLIAVPVVLAGCAGVQDQFARDAARQAVRPVLAERFPGVPLEPASDCVITYATGAEIAQLALAATQPVVHPTTTALVVEIATRPETLRCLATDGLAPFLN
jgi:hypothetical protein